MTKTTFLRCLLALTALAALPFAASTVRAAADDILETNETNILRFRPVGGTPTTFVSGLSNPKGIVCDGLGKVYVSDPGRSQIVTFTLPDATASTYATGLSAPNGLVFDPAGNLYVAESGSGNILKYDRVRNRTTFATGLGNPSSLAFDSGGNLFSTSFSGGQVYKIAPDGTKETFASGLNFPAGIAIDSADNVFVAISEDGTILKFAPDGSRTTFASDLSRPYGLAFERGGTLVVADNGSGGTFRYTASGSRSNIFSSEFNTPAFVAIEPAPHVLLNVSTRGLVQGGDNTLIAGFNVGGTGQVGTRIIVRALGPSLSAFGVTNALPDPVIELRNAAGTLIASNNNWRDTQEQDIVDTTLQPTNDNEAAIVTFVAGGAFTAVVGSATGEAGTAVVDVYNLQ
ncbi:MAG TPA: NHL repeat-containing protein [Chthoniobacterales bacterium]|nr:NHL repeat-containing protein [Chthoniobacterales bacterium]